MQTNNREFEQQVLGLLLKEPTHRNSRETFDSLSPDDFTNEAHRMIFKTLKTMSEDKKTIDMATAESELNVSDRDYGGYFYLVELVRGAISIFNMPAYVGGIKKASSLRQLSSCLFSANELVAQGMPAEDIIENLSGELKEISKNSNGKKLQHISQAASDWFDVLERREAAGGGVLGIRTGIDELDERLSGIDEESLVVIAGRPSMGKTLLCQCLAQNIAVEQGKNIMFFSMEMSKVQLFERFVSGLSNVSSRDLRTANISGAENRGRIEKAITDLDNSGIYYDEEPNQSVGQIRAKVRRHKERFPDLSMIMVDYLGLMKLGKADRHDIAVGDVTRSLKELAKEMKVPVILIAQANRGLDKAARPTMSNIKDSSAIEADADVIMFIHRQEVVEPETELKGLTELIIAKDRHNDGNGTVYLEKINGTFKSLTNEQAGMMQAKEDVRLNPPKPYKEFR
jgi:replicative DNA helicase